MIVGVTVPLRIDRLACRALLRSRYAVHTMAFHPTLPLLMIGTGRYDWQDPAARAEGHIALVHRPDWAVIPPRSITVQELAGPRGGGASPRRSGPGSHLVRPRS